MYEVADRGLYDLLGCGFHLVPYLAPLSDLFLLRLAVYPRPPCSGRSRTSYLVQADEALVVLGPAGCEYPSLRVLPSSDGGPEAASQRRVPLLVVGL